ncbi:MAG: ShlB/FhaC/HecB family hemolysin secretion/activation protein, partial [Leptolyngbya sp. RL_3_1]|nr:ShlB/FhaC/HecB family hemolysin secretion/activation protein [Leptolyngbya sp. RL_3_1]
LRPPQDSAPFDPPPDAGPAQIVVNQFRVVGSTVFSDAELAAVLAPFVDRPLSFGELLAASRQVTELYVSNGYVTTGAFIPAGQVIDGGVVTIQVVEGRLAEIDIDGLQRLNPDYVRSRIATATPQPLNIQTLLETLQILQLNPLIESLSAELVATPNPGENNLLVTVTEADSFDLQFQLSNRESPLLSTFQQRVDIREGNLTGNGDALTVTYQHAGQSNTLQLGYSLPISPSNTTFEGTYSYVDSQVVEPPLGLINPQSEAHTWQLGVRHPILETPQDKITLGLALEQRRSQTFLQPPGLSRIPFGFPGSGTSSDGFIKLTTLSFTQEWQQQTPDSLLFLGSEFRLGTGLLGASGSDDARDPGVEYLTWQGQLLWLQRLNPNWLLIARSALQVSDRPLVSAEQFSLGGAGSVRGYRADRVLADNGWLLSLELQTPILDWPEQSSTVTLATFLDYGLAWNQDGQALNIEGRDLAAIGAGLIWDVDNRFNVRLDWALPIINVQNSGSTLQESGFTFSITGNL